MNRLASAITVLFLAGGVLAACGEDEDASCRFDFDYPTSTGTATTQGCAEKLPDNVCANLVGSAGASCTDAPFEQCGDSDIWIVSPGADVKDTACAEASLAVLGAAIEE